jgi:hypothetical protein
MKTDPLLTLSKRYTIVLRVSSVMMDLTTQALLEYLQTSDLKQMQEEACKVKEGSVRTCAHRQSDLPRSD